MAVPNNNKWGATFTHMRDAHPAVIPYTKSERSIANKLINGESTEGHQITRRIKVLVLSEIKEALTDKGVTSEKIAETLIKSMDPDSKYWARGKNYEFALTTILKFNGIDIKKDLDTEEDIPLTHLIEGVGTRSLSAPPSEDRPATVRDIKKMLNLANLKNVEKAEIVE